MLSGVQSIQTHRMVTRRTADSQFDLFVPYVANLPMRDQRETMERPFFSLSKRKRLKAIEYTSRDGIFVKVTANPEFGMATIWDADVLIWAASVLNGMRKRGENDLPRTLHFHPYDLLKTIQRETGGREYKLLREGLGRLQATTVVTNIRVSRGKKHRQFSWIEGWTDLQDEETGASRGMTLTLSEWFYEGILMDGGLLSIDPVYFSITGGRERWLYRVARKHAGGAGPEGFAISLQTLYEKSGAEGTYRRFKFEMQAIAHRNELPHFELRLEHGKGEPLLRMTRRGAAEASLPAGSDAPPAADAWPEPASHHGHASPTLSLFQAQPAETRRAVSEETLARIRRDFPGWDLSELQREFDGWLADDERREPANYDAAFYGFVRQHHTRRA
jgi:plasmid replication initiation protein